MITVVGGKWFWFCVCNAAIEVLYSEVVYFVEDFGFF